MDEMKNSLSDLVKESLLIYSNETCKLNCDLVCKELSSYLYEPRGVFLQKGNIPILSFYADDCNTICTGASYQIKREGTQSIVVYSLLPKKQLLFACIIGETLYKWIKEKVEGEEACYITKNASLCWDPNAQLTEENFVQKYTQAALRCFGKY